MRNSRVVRSLIGLSIGPLRANINLHKGNKLAFRSFATSIVRKIYQINPQSLKNLKDENSLDMEEDINPNHNYKYIPNIISSGTLVAYVLIAPHIDLFQNLVSAIISFSFPRFLKNNIDDTELSLESLSLIRKLSEGKDIIGKIKPAEVRESSSEIFEEFTLFFGLERPISKLLRKGADPKLMKLSLLKTKIDSYYLYTVRRLLSKDITTELEGEVGAIEYALKIYPQHSKMVKLLQEYKEKKKNFGGEQQTENFYNKKLLPHLNSEKTMHSRS